MWRQFSTKNRLLKKLDKKLKPAKEEQPLGPEQIKQLVQEDSKFENEYERLAKYMVEKREMGARKAESVTWKQMLDDYEREKSDREAAKGSGIQFKRPPRSAKEALNALKQADERFEANKSSLIGSEKVKLESR